MKLSSRIACRLLIPLMICSANLWAGDQTVRFELTLGRILKGGPPAYTDEFVLADAVPQHVRRFTEFSGDVSGRYIGALAEAAQVTGKGFPELDRVVGKILKLQQADGHFGEPMSTEGVKNSDMALLWGNGRLLVGLLEYHRYKPTPEVLASARRLGEFMVNIGPRLNADSVRETFSGDQVAVGYICWTQIIEGMVELFRATSDARYLKLAEQMAANTRHHPKQHSHGFATSLRGILELYRVTHNPKQLEQVESEWQSVIDTGNLLPHGALPEIFKPMMARDEGCSEADWLRLNLALWLETHKPRYLENAELTLFNEFAFNQFHTGDFGHHTFSSEGISPVSARAWWCCTFHGLRAYADLFRSVFHAEPERLCFDLPADGRGEIDGLAMQANSNLGQDASVTLVVTKADGKEHLLSIRQPAWASAIQLKLGRRPLSETVKAGKMDVSRLWKKGETVTILYTMRTRQVEDKSHPKRVAFMHGPWFLGVDEQNSPTFYDEPSSQNRIVLPAVAENGDLPLERLEEKSTLRHPFAAPQAHLKLQYFPGGYPIQPQSAVLRPIAEHTTLADGTEWTFWFEPKK